MKIDLRADQPIDEVSAKKVTGKSLAEWFALLDQFGGPERGRRDLGQWLTEAHQVDPYWVATINIEYEAAHGLREKDGRAKGYTICATKSIKADPMRCHEAFATAEALDRWLGTQHVIDLRDGGSWRDGDGNQAQVKKINPGKTIKLIWQHPAALADTPVEVKFQPSGAKTSVIVTHERLQTRAAADGARRAWGEALDRLKQRLEE